MKTVGLLLCGVLLGASAALGWLIWYFRDVYK